MRVKVLGHPQSFRLLGVRLDRVDPSTSAASQTKAEEEKPVLFEKLFHLDVNWWHELRSGEQARSGPGDETRRERETQLVEQTCRHEVRVQSWTTFEEHRPVT